MLTRSSLSVLRRARTALWWVLGLALLLFALPASAQGSAAVAAATTAAAPKPDTKTKCLNCHDDAAMKSDAGKPLAVLADDFARGAHRKLDCAECHDAALTVKHPRNPLGAVKPQVCQDCHSDEFKAIAGSIHGRRAAGERAIKDCNGCHGSLHTVHRAATRPRRCRRSTRSRPVAPATRTCSRTTRRASTHAGCSGRA